MADAKDDEYYQNYLRKLYDDQTGTGELTQTKSHNFNMEVDGSVDTESSENMIKVEPLTIAIKKAAAAIVLTPDTSKSKGELIPTESHNFDMEAGVDITKSESSENMIKVEPLTKTTDIAVKKAAAAIVLTPDTFKNKSELTQTESHNFDMEADDSVDITISESSENMIKVEPLTKTTNIVVKKTVDVIVLTPDTSKNKGELTQTKSHNFDMDADDSVDITTSESSENMIKVEPLAKTTDTAVKKAAAAIVLTPDTSKNKAQQAPVFLKKNRLESNTSKKVKCEAIVSESVDDTIPLKNPKQEEVYEFDENEQDPDNPGDITDLDLKSKGIIKQQKEAKTNEPASGTCTTCSYQTNKKHLLSRHLKSHSNDRPHKCSVCEKDFKTRTGLVNHRITHLGYKPHECSSCDMAFTTSGELKRHQRYQHGDAKPHKCIECDYSCVEKSKLHRHMRCHTGERPHQCPQCTYAAPDAYTLKGHLRTHTGEKPFECDICHGRFTQKSSLKQHRLLHSGNVRPVFQCQLCPTACRRKPDLQYHIKIFHNSDQPIPCKRCGKELPDRYTYKMHIKAHGAEKRYRCEYCPYASISKLNVESHASIHLKPKKFSCEICPSSFRQKSQFTRHMNVYHLSDYTPPEPNKKDHKCKHCNKKFTFNGYLMRHMETHHSTCRLTEEKEKLKLRRSKRVTTEKQRQVHNEEYQEEYAEAEECNEDNIPYVYDDCAADECEESDVEQQDKHQLDEASKIKLLIDVKQEKIQTMDIAQTLTVKNIESNESEIMSLGVQDDQGFVVVKVLPGDDNDEEQKVQLQIAESSKAITDNINQSTAKTL